MNKLILGLPGGHPLYHEHLHFQNEAFRNAIIAISKGFEISDPVRLYGLQRSGNTITGGALLKDGEIYMFAEKTNVDPPLLGYQDVIQVSIESPSEGWVKFADNDFKQVLEIRRAIHAQKANDDITPDDIILSSLKGFSEVLFRPVISANFSLSSGWLAAESGALGSPRALKTRDGLVRLLGAIVIAEPGSPPPSSTAFTLPEGFRPKHDMILYPTNMHSAVVEHVMLSITASTGAVIIGYPVSPLHLYQVSFNIY